jgi:hypothetical protein
VTEDLLLRRNSSLPGRLFTGPSEQRGQSHAGTSVRGTAAQTGQIWRPAHADYVDWFGRA